MNTQGYRLLRPGFPITDTMPANHELYIIISTSARIVGPALRDGDIQCLLYHRVQQAETVFRYLGRVDYRWAQSRRHVIHL